MKITITTNDQFEKIYEADFSFLGTKNYMGVAYFWSYAYRHYLRDASCIQRIKVHNAFLKAGLPLNGESKEHFSIISKLIK